MIEASRSFLFSEVTKPRVLIVDDESADRRLLSKVLENQGYQTCSASNGQEMFGLLDDFQPMLILLDIFMPVLGGYETLRLLRQREGFMIPVIAVTGMHDPAELRKLSSYGFAGYITKPFRTAQFIGLVQKVLTPP